MTSKRTNNIIKHFVLILDGSWSMIPTKKDTIKSVNEAIFTYRQDMKDQDALWTLVTFSEHNKIRTVQDSVPISRALELNDKSYNIDGGTALYDAIGITLTKLRHKDHKFVVIIVTDGEDNDSCWFNRKEIFKKIAEFRETGKWEFVFMGANQNAYSSGRSIGIDFNIDFECGLNMPKMIRELSHAVSEFSNGNPQLLRNISSSSSSDLELSSNGSHDLSNICTTNNFPRNPSSCNSPHGTISRPSLVRQSASAYVYDTSTDFSMV